MLMVEAAPMGWARPCDSCRVVPCLVYCEADTAYLCSGCDARVHAANRVASRHKRVWVCEACERSPAVITCKADAAVLCAACDVDIHSANPLARRHHRVPISPVSSEDVAVGQRRIRGCDPLLVRRVDGEAEDEEEIYDCKDEMGSWLLMNPMIKNNNNSNGLLYGGEIDEYLDLGYYSSSVENQYQNQIYQQQKEQEKREGKDGIVPARFLARVTDLNQQIQFDEEENFQLGLEYGTPKSEFCYNTTDSISHCVSLSSVDTSFVPDTSTIEIIKGRSCSNGTSINLLSTIPNYQIQPQFSPVNREARVLRYREKRKMRKFEKTIRYASRKAYAEVRPRIKGRFAKRSEVEVEVDQMFLTAISTEGSYEYGIVPSF